MAYSPRPSEFSVHPEQTSNPHVDTDPDPYTEEEMQKLIAAANDFERLVIRFFVGSGCREQEVAKQLHRGSTVKGGTHEKSDQDSRCCSDDGTVADT
jgi:hypothetical protein